MIATETRPCMACGKTLKGRIDKKFCDDYCRNGYNNLKKQKDIYPPLVRSINSALSRNRKILASLLRETGGTARVRRDELLECGFQFRYFTHVYATRTGKTYYYCYDHGYLPLDNACYLVVKRKED